MVTKPNNKIKASYVWGAARIAMGLIFLWAFVDKLYGLGYSTCANAKTGIIYRYCDASWLNGGSPTKGFLANAVKGPFADIYHHFSGNALVDWLFMMGLLGIGLALVLGILVKLAAKLGILLLALMYLAVLPPSNNPVLDEHIIYILLLAGLMFVNEDQKLGLGKKWAKTKLVKSYPILK